jgi:hypothetical protein
LLLLRDAELESRRGILNGPLAELAHSLETELSPLSQRDIYVPRAKALLSRAGGRCEHDGTALEFDPYSPDEHRCPACGTSFTGETHHRAWIYPYQLWLAERAVHAAVLGLLQQSDRWLGVSR